MVNKRRYKNNRSYRTGYDDGYDDGFGKGLIKSRNKIDKLTNDIIEADRLNEELTAKNKEMRETNRKQQEVNRKQQEVNRKQRKELKEQEIKLEEQEIKLEEQEIELNVQKGRLDGLKKRQEEIDAEVKELEIQYANNLEEINTLGAETDELISENEGLDFDIFSLKNKTISSKSGRKRLSALIKDLEEDMSENKKIIGRNQRRTNKLIKENEGVISKKNAVIIKSYYLNRDEIRMA